jgi:hypothetical protein
MITSEALKWEVKVAYKPKGVLAGQLWKKKIKRVFK